MLRNTTISTSIIPDTPSVAYKELRQSIENHGDRRWESRCRLFRASLEAFERESGPGTFIKIKRGVKSKMIDETDMGIGKDMTRYGWRLVGSRSKSDTDPVWIGYMRKGGVQNDL